MTASAQNSAVDTGKVTGRRELHFNTIDDALADAEQLAAAEEDGRLQRLGNWTLGQTLGHLATWCEFAFNGNPLKPPLPIKLILRMMKKRFITGPMKSGARIPGVQNGTLGTEPMETSQALPRFQTVMQRLNRECPDKPNVIFGRMTHDEWIQMQMRHCELHLSFFKIT